MFDNFLRSFNGIVCLMPLVSSLQSVVEMKSAQSHFTHQSRKTTGAIDNHINNDCISFSSGHNLCYMLVSTCQNKSGISKFLTTYVQTGKIPFNCKSETLAKPPTFMMHALDEVSYLRDTINAKTKIRDKDEPALFFRWLVTHSTPWTYSKLLTEIHIQIEIRRQTCFPVLVEFCEFSAEGCKGLFDNSLSSGGFVVLVDPLESGHLCGRLAHICRKDRQRERTWDS